MTITPNKKNKSGDQRPLKKRGITEKPYERSNLKKNMKCDWCGNYTNKSNSIRTHFGYFCSRKCCSDAEKNGLKENYNPDEQDNWQVLNDPNREWDIKGGCSKIIGMIIFCVIAAFIILYLTGEL